MSDILLAGGLSCAQVFYFYVFVSLSVILSSRFHSHKSTLLGLVFLGHFGRGVLGMGCVLGAHYIVGEAPGIIGFFVPVFLMFQKQIS